MSTEAASKYFDGLENRNIAPLLKVSWLNASERRHASMAVHLSPCCFAMDASIIYFDNAATTFPKPEEVYKALDAQFRQAGNSGRGGHALAMGSARTIFAGREALADFFGVKRSERLIFTPGCTQSINMVLRSGAIGRAVGVLSGKGESIGSAKSLGSRRWLQKDRVVLISSLEHNAVMRPLHQLQKVYGFRIEALPYKPGAFCDLRDLSTALETYKPTLVILTEGSNVTGEMIDWFVAADLCKQHAVPLLIDAAQTAGRFPGCLAHEGISFWCASAHKGLMGPQGLGLLYVHPDFDLEPLVSGGTGSASEQFDMPDVYPDRLESGTMPAPLIAGLSAGVEWMQKIAPLKIQEHEDKLAMRFLQWCEESPAVKIYGFPQTEPGAPVDFKLDLERVSNRLPIVSFKVAGHTPEHVAELLQQKANIAVRSGLHCAAQAHRTLGTQSTGLIRASFSIFNTLGEVDLLCRTLEQIISTI